VFQKFVSTLKKLLGGSKPAVPKPPAASKKETSKSPRPSNKKYPHEKREGEHHPRDVRKKETREEYRLRHEKRDREKSNKQILVSAKETPEQIIPSVSWDSSAFKVPIVDGKTRFHDLNLPDEIMHAIYDMNFQYTTGVQSEVLPKSLAGEDITAQAQTGTGKTAAFLITILSHILRNPISEKRAHGTPRALILAPTRELVMQIEKDARLLGKYVPCSIVSLVGGIDYKKQMDRVKHEPIDIVMATPGRLIDFKKQKVVDLGKVEILIIDEADRMLDMGFIPSVKYIVLATPQKAKRQTMFFSATMTSEVKRLSESWTRQAFAVSIAPEEVASANIEQLTYITTKEEKFALFYNLMNLKQMERVLVFVNRKDVARNLREKLETYGITCTLLSGDVDQHQRIKRLENFREGKVRVLVATDVASRGIHVDAISHVVNYNLPQDAEEYVHRIGRTGRAGASGISISFADEEDSYEIPKIEEFLGNKLECLYPDESLLVPVPEVFPRKEMKKEKTVRKDSTRRRTYKRPPRKPSA
jgi:ATP-dependent RNA helicase RhlB